MSKDEVDPRDAPASRVRTWDVLRGLGFEPDPDTMSHSPGALKKDFGNVTLSAIHCLTRRFANVVMLSGVLTTPESITEIECEMPQELESRELGVAWVTWCLDRHTKGQFRPTIPTPWLAEGRAWRHLLPRERSLAAHAEAHAKYLSCPRCLVERRLVRSAIRDLLAHLGGEPDETPVIIRFDGELLVIRCQEQIVAVPATGTAWQSQFVAFVGSIRALPPRFRRDPVELALFNGGLVFDGHRVLGELL